MMGETIPKEESFVALDSELKDAWGIPQLRVSVGYDDNNEKMIRDFHEQMSEILTACMTSTSTQNPSLTFMAIMARAANHAVSELKKGDF